MGEIRFGKVLGESIGEYHACEAVSHSKLEDFRRLPLLYFRRYIAKDPLDADLFTEKETSSLAVGQGLHTEVLEHAFDERYVIQPDFGDCRLKENKARRDAWREANAGRVPITVEDAMRVARMAAAVAEHPLASQLLARGEAEVTWRHPLKHFSVQCRSDWFNEHGCELTAGEPYFVDLKSVASLSEDDFRNWKRNFFDYGYYRQGPFYGAVTSEVWKREVARMFYIVVENKQPFQCQVFTPSPRSWERGMSEVVTDLRRLAECYENNRWPGAPQDLQVIDLPEWFYKRSS